VDNDRNVPIRELILVPSLITLAVTILRLVGELQNWAPGLFSKDAGGGGALVGIAWLVPIFGIYFAVRLVQGGYGPANVWPVLGSAVGALVLTIVVVIAVNAAGLPMAAGFLAMGITSLVAVWITLRAWPALGRTLVAYGLAARIPVILVMLIAILQNWGTHYDVAPPDSPQVDAWNPLLKWFVIGVWPQLTAWIAFTVVIGAIFGAIAAAVARRARRPATA
jgi:hypothetical protein